jgi:hypothetical protein
VSAHASELDSGRVPRRDDRGVRVIVTGTVKSAKLITGTISIVSPGCELSKREYRAKLFGTLPA